MSAASKATTNFLSDLAARAFQELATKAVDEGVSRVGRFAGNLRDKVREDTYKKYTDPLTAGGTAGAAQDESGKWVGQNPREVKEFYTPGGKKRGSLRSEVAGDDPWNAPQYDSDTKTWHARGTHTVDPENWRETTQRVFYENPERTAEVAGYAAPVAAAGTLVGGLAAGSWLFGEQRNPQSDYRVPVQPSKHQGGYNPSVESALASASAKYELQEQKHAHDMELQRLRMEAKNPGSQYSDPSMPDVSAGAPSMQDMWRSPSLFGDSKYMG